MIWSGTIFIIPTVTVTLVIILIMMAEYNWLERKAAVARQVWQTRGSWCTSGQHGSGGHLGQPLQWVWGWWRHLTERPQKVAKMTGWGQNLGGTKGKWCNWLCCLFLKIICFGHSTWTPACSRGFTSSSWACAPCTAAPHVQHHAASVDWQQHNHNLWTSKSTLHPAGQSCKGGPGVRQVENNL